MRHLLTIMIFIIAAASTSAATLTTEQLNRYWQEVTLTVDDVLEDMYDIVKSTNGSVQKALDARCYLGSRPFTACYMGVNGIGAELDPPRRLVVTSWLTQPEWKNVRLLKSFGRMSLVEGAPSLAANLTPAQVLDWQRGLYAEVEDVANKEIADLMHTKTEAESSGKAGPLIPPIEFNAIIKSIQLAIPKTVPEAKLAIDVASQAALMSDVHSHYELAKNLNLQARRSNPEFSGPSIDAERATGSPIVEVSTLQDMGYQIIEIKLHEFIGDPHALENACSTVAKTVAESEPWADGYILDLRNISGGQLAQAVCISGLFVDNQPIVQKMNLTSDRFEAPLMGKDPKLSSFAVTTKKPLTVIINDRSVNLPEFVAGALQGLERAWITGTRSYGNATTEDKFQVPGQPNLVLFKTVGRYFVPVIGTDGTIKMRTNERVGVHPDFPVPSSPGDKSVAKYEGEDAPFAQPTGAEIWDLPPRSIEAAAIDLCIQHNRRADKIYAQSSSQDYQSLNAEEITACEIARSQPQP